MSFSDRLHCEECGGEVFTMKREVTYLYTYEMNISNIENLNKGVERLPFLFDNREKVDSKEYLECSRCGAKYSYLPEKDYIQLTILQKAIRSDYQKKPQYLG